LNNVKEEKKIDIFPCRFTVISAGSNSAALTNIPTSTAGKVTINS
jgi:hypothetical protein